MLVAATHADYLAAFQHGWVVPNIDTVAAHVQRATRAGLRLHHARNLTAGLRIYALPDWLARGVLSALSLFMRNMFLRSLIGSIALQQCYRHTMMQYQFLVFYK